MNQKTTLLLAVGLVLACGGVYWAQKDAAKPKPIVDSGAAKPLFEPKPTDVVKVEMVAWGKPAMVFEKTDDNWNIVAPIKAPADKNQIDSQITRMSGLQTAKQYKADDTARPGDDTTRLKDQPAWVVKMTDKAGKTVALRIGQQVLLSSDTYGQVEGSDVVVVIKGDLNNELKADLEQYRNKQVAQFTVADAVRVTLSGSRAMTLAKSPDGKWMVEQPVKARADAAAVNAMLSAVSGATAQKFINDAPKGLGIYGLENPRLTVSVDTQKKKLKTPPAGQPPASQPEFETENRTITLCFGTGTEGKVFAKLGGAETPWVFQLADTTLTAASPELTKLRDKAITSVATNNATNIKVGGAKGTVELEKKDGLWRIAAPAELAGIGGDNRAEFAAVDDLLKAIRDLKATDFETETLTGADYGFDDSATQIEIAAEGSLEPLKLTIGKTTPAGTGVYLRNDREGNVAVVKAESAVGLRVAPMAFVSRKLMQFTRENVQKIEIESEGVTRTAVKVGSAWRLAAPVDAVADGTAAGNIVADLASLDARTIAGTASDLAKFGLDKPALSCRVVVQPPPHPAASAPVTSQPASSSAPTMIQDPPTTYALIAAKSGGKAYVFVDGETRIGEVDDKIFRDLTTELHQHSVADFDASKLVGVELKYTDRSMNFEKKGDDWTLEREPGFKGDANKVKGIGDAFKALATERFVDFAASDLAKFKLATPMISVTVRVEGGATHELRVASDGPAGDETNRRYATVVGSNKVFLISATDIAKFDKQIKDFEASATPPPTELPPPGGMPGGMGG